MSADTKCFGKCENEKRRRSEILNSVSGEDTLLVSTRDPSNADNRNL